MTASASLSNPGRPPDSPAKSCDIYFLNLPANATTVATEAARLAFPHGEIHLITEAAAIGGGYGSRCLVVLADPAPAASLISETGESPRCAVVVLGGPSDLVETVTASDWNPPLLARVFRSALLQHELLCENLRLRGDLRTVARRISHDLRTPVGCIHTTSDILPELDAASMPGMVGVIRQSSSEISQIIDRVSFVLKASADPTPSTEVDMGLLVGVVLRQLESEIQKARAIVVQPASWPEVAGVAGWLQVIWTNLLTNALHHSGPSAKIRISWERYAREYRFLLSDHGPGVPAERQASLFSPFDQLHSIRTSGLGLSIVERLVALQGGRCGYEKPAEGGACFYFTLPASTPES